MTIVPAEFQTDLGAICCPHCGALYMPGDEIKVGKIGPHLIGLLCTCGEKSLLSDDRLDAEEESVTLDADGTPLDA